MNQKIENLIVKFLMNTANINELESLTIWLKKPKNRQIFKSFVKTNYAMDINMKQFDIENVKKEYLSKIKKDKSVFYRYRFLEISKYAAAAVILFGLGFFFRDNLFHQSTENDAVPIIVNTNTIEPGIDKATLTLEDGSEITLEKGASFQTKNANSNGEEIIYEAGKRTPKEIAYNYLTIPRGGQFYIVLSDGTKVWLNSESQLKYPVSFKEGEARQVELVYGEALFDVTPSSKHKGARFKVFNNAQEVEVVGTVFNIKAYKDETNVYTTLVEGKVNVSMENLKQSLIPNQQLHLDLKTNISIVKTVNTYNEISWKDGVFSFEQKPLAEIMKVLSRWYDKEVVFENTDLKEITFTGILGKNQKVKDVLSTLKTLSTVKDYEINNKTITLK